jgi:hypothetical protein
VPNKRSGVVVYSIACGVRIAAYMSGQGDLTCQFF